MQFIKKSMLLPKEHSSRLMFGDLSDDEVRNLPTELTDKEKKCPHAKYYGAEIPFLKVHQDIINAGKLMDPSKAFEMKDYVSAGAIL